MRYLFRNARLYDFARGGHRGPLDVLVEGDRIREISERELATDGAEVVDCDRRVLVPGLIDAHVHVIGVSLDPTELTRIRPYLLAARASQVLRGMLQRGFTTVRDAGGADGALAQAVEEGHFHGPRLFVSGLALAQTGGQGDFRPPGETALGCPVCSGLRSLTAVVDGVDAVRRCARQQLREGAHQIKVMASGGIASGVPLERCHFSIDELEAAVDEAGRADTYVMAHAYEDAAVGRCLDAGVRSIEHGSHLGDDTLARMRAGGAFLVPTLAAYDALAEEGPGYGLTPERVALFDSVRRASLDTCGRAHAQGLAIGHGSDLEGPLHARQSAEFALKARVMPAAEVVRSATEVNARLLGREAELGRIAPGALADLLVVDGDPYEDAAVLARPERSIRLIMKGGAVVRNRL